MATKKILKVVGSATKKLKEIKPIKKNVVQRLVAERNVDRFKLEGWRVVSKINELTLMEKTQ